MCHPHQPPLPFCSFPTAQLISLPRPSLFRFFLLYSTRTLLTPPRERAVRGASPGDTPAKHRNAFADAHGAAAQHCKTTLGSVLFVIEFFYPTFLLMGLVT